MDNHIGSAVSEILRFEVMIIFNFWKLDSAIGKKYVTFFFWTGYDGNWSHQAQVKIIYSLFKSTAFL